MKSCEDNHLEKSINNRFGRCKNCSQLYEKNKSEYICDDCYPLCVCDKPLKVRPLPKSPKDKEGKE